MSAHKRTAGFAQHLVRARHHRGEVRLDLVFEPVGHGGDRQRRLRLSAHRIDVAERVVRRDLAQHVGVVDDGAEIIDCLQRELLPADIDERRVIRRVEPHDYVGPRGRFDLGQCAREHGGAHLGAAAAAAHGDGGNFLERLAVGQRRQRCRNRLHLRQLVVLAHEAAIDPILPAPHPCALDHQTIAGPDRIAFSGRNQIERLALRPESPQGLAGERTADVVGKRWPCAHGVDAGLRQLAAGKRDRIARREHVVVTDNPERFVDPEKAAGIERQSGLRQPARRRRLRSP